ncbi:uncharacterized protein V6R79_005365 [Siganus canaliculatus]
MQSSDGEGGGEEGRGSGLQDASGNAAGHSGNTDPAAQEDQSEPQADDLTSEPQPEPSKNHNSPVAAYLEQDTVSQMQLIPHLSTLNASEDMEEEEDQEEEEELLVLDPKHPLVKKQQDALNNQLRRHLENISLNLEEKRSQDKADANHLLELSVQSYKVQEQLAKLQTRLEDFDHTMAQAETKHQQAQDQLQETKNQHSSLSSKDRTVKATVSQLQSELDNLMLKLVFTQGLSEELHLNVKAMKNMQRKAGAEKSQAEEQKMKQDLYVKRLTEDMERLTQQIDLCDVQTSAQAEETQAVKEALAEAETEMESLMMSRKQLLQQWNSSLMALRRKDEALTAMQEAVRDVHHQMVLLDGEIDSYKKTTNEEEELNETLTVQLNWSQMDCASSKKLIHQKQTQHEALLAQYTMCLRTLEETELTLARVSKEASSHQADIKEQKKQLEKESAARLELEDKIVTHMQQKLTHNRAAKYSQRLTSQMASLKKEKTSHLWQLEHDMEVVGLECTNVTQRLDGLALTLEALDKEVAKCNTLLKSDEAKMSSLKATIKQKQAAIASYNKKIHEIAAKTGHEDMSPLEIKQRGLKSQIEELDTNINSDKQLWMKQQGILVGLTQEIEANSKDMLKLQAKYTGLRQKKIRLESLIEAEHREETELEKNSKVLKKDLLKLNMLLSKNRQLSLALEQENSWMETDFLCKLKEAEQESIEMQMKLEKTEEEKDRLLNCLVETERQIHLWEKKIQLLKETRLVVDSSGNQEIQVMKTEIHRMEVRLSVLMKQRERLLRESEATVARRETLVFRRDALIFNIDKQKRTPNKGELYLVSQGLRHKIQHAHKQVGEFEVEVKRQQEIHLSLSNRLKQQRQQLQDLCGRNYILESDIMNLQDSKDRNLVHLMTLQNRAKKLQGVCQGSYKTSSSHESIGAALQSQTECAHMISTILYRVCQEFPQHQGPLRRVSQALAAHMAVVERGTP